MKPVRAQLGTSLRRILPSPAYRNRLHDATPFPPTMTQSITQWLPLRLAAAGYAGLPKYVRLRNVLAEAISDGHLAAGAQLPPEDALTGVSGLSLGTVQKALRSLVDDGLVSRKQGMGTFVTAADTPMNAPLLHCRFLGDDGKTALPIFSRVLRRKAARGDGVWRQHLPAAAPVCIERIFSINNEFSVYTHLYVDAARFPAINSLPLEAFNGLNFKNLFARDFHHAPARFTEALTINLFPAYVCKALRVKPTTAGGVVNIMAHDRRGEPLYFQDLWIPPNHRQLHLLG